MGAIGSGILGNAADDLIRKIITISRPARKDEALPLAQYAVMVRRRELGIRVPRREDLLDFQATKSERPETWHVDFHNSERRYRVDVPIGSVADIQVRVVMPAEYVEWDN